MTTDHYDPHGQALLDYFNGDASATIVIHEYGKQKEVPLSLFFRGWDEFPSLERKAIVIIARLTAITYIMRLVDILDGPIPPIVQRIERQNIISARSNILRRISLTSTKSFVYSAGQSSVEGPAVRIVGT